MTEILPIEAAQDVLKYFFIDKGKNEFGHDFGNMPEFHPEFDVHRESQVFKDAAEGLGFRVVIEIIDATRIRIKKVSQ